MISNDGASVNCFGFASNRIDACGTEAEYAFTTVSISAQQAQALLELSFALSCAYYHAASAIDPGIIPYIPIPFQACAVDPCNKPLEECLENPWQPDWNREDFGPRKDCGACYRECKHAGGIWPEYKCPR